MCTFFVYMKQRELNFLVKVLLQYFNNLINSIAILSIIIYAKFELVLDNIDVQPIVAQNTTTFGSANKAFIVCF